MDYTTAEIHMPIPEEIRKVERPKNTIVNDNGRNGPLRYSVRIRTDTKYIPGKNPQPHNGKVIGHIVNGKYVPLDTKTVVADEPNEASYGTAALVKSVSNDVFNDLLEVFPPKDTYTIMAMAMLRIIKPGITLQRMSMEYRRTFVSVFYPGAPLSRNHLSDFLENLGMDFHKRVEFYQRRIAAIAEYHHIAIDGSLKINDSSVNDLSAFTYRSKEKGRKEISLIYAYDIELKEPVCAEVFPGNCIDASAYKSFIRDNDIKRGIIVADKGFPPSKIQEELAKRPELHFLTPLKRNDSRIAANDMFAFDGTLNGVDRNILYKVKRIKGGNYLYALKDMGKAGSEGVAYVERARKNNDFDLATYQKKEISFGTIVFESDLEMDPKTAYLCYANRWMIELVFNHYKNEIDLKQSRVHNDFSILGSEFVNLIATILSCRIVAKMEESGLLDTMTYGEIMDDLSTVWRKTDAPLNPMSNDEYWVHAFKYCMEEMEALHLSQPAESPHPRKRGRPKKVQNHSP